MMQADAYCVFQLHIAIVPQEVSVNVIVADRHGIPALFAELTYLLVGIVWQDPLLQDLWKIDLSVLLICMTEGITWSHALMPYALVQIAQGKISLYRSCQLQQVRMV